MAGVHGIVLLDKPQGFSSTQALSRVKHLLGTRKAGHTGTLDPLATGMLPLCFGEATKVAGRLLGSRKAYRATVRLGVTTDTADAEGAVIAESAVPEIDAAALTLVLQRFVGRIRQRPPAYSALKRDGVPLYRLARQGVVVEAPEREVDVHRIELLERAANTLDLQVECGTGTYIRSLAVDIGTALGCGGHVAALRRLWVEPFQSLGLVTLDELEAEAASTGTPVRHLLPIDSGLAGMPRIELDPAESARMRHGHAVQRPQETWLGECRIYDDGGRLLALAERDAAGAVQPRRVLVYGEEG